MSSQRQNFKLIINFTVRQIRRAFSY